MLHSHRPPSLPFLTLLVFARAFSIVLALQANRTIDDTYGDSVTGLKVVYNSPWNTGQLCPGCRVQPDAAEAFEGTWHDTTTGGTAHYATMKFNGMYPSCFLPTKALAR